MAESSDFVTVRLADGSLIRFPKSMSDEQILEVLRQKFPAAPAPGVAEDVAKASLGGLQRGITGLIDLGALALGAVTGAGNAGLGTVTVDMPSPLYTPEGALQQAAEKGATPLGQFGDMLPSYRAKTTPGKYAQTGAEFVPGALLGPGSIGRKLAYGAVAPGVASESAGQFFEGTSMEGPARLAAALAAPMGLGAAELKLRSLASPGGGADPLRLASAEVLRRYGIEPTAGQTTGVRDVLFRESVTEAGSRAQGRTSDQFMRAVLKTAGITGDRATPSVIDDAFTKTGQQMDDLVAQSGISLDAMFVSDLKYAAENYALNGGTAPRPQNVIQSVITAARSGNGTIFGGAYQNIKQQLDEAAKSGDADLRQFAIEARTALNDALGRTAAAAGNPALVAEWATLNNSYKNLIPIAEASIRAKSGVFTPSQLQNALIKQNRRNVMRGKGDLADLAKSGYNVIENVPTSGTSERLKAMGMGGAGSAVSGGALALLAGAEPTGAAMAAMASSQAPRAINAFVATPAGQQWARNQLFAPDLPQASSRYVLPALPGLLTSLQGQQ